jgi:hypothetical protein
VPAMAWAEELMAVYQQVGWWADGLMVGFFWMVLDDLYSWM